MLRYNINLSSIENQRPRCNKRATRVGYVSTPKAFTLGSEDWSLYGQRFQHFLLVKGITEESQKLHLLLALVGYSTLRLLTNLVVSRLTFKKALTELERHFKPKPFKIAEHFWFYKWNQQTGEIWCVFQIRNSRSDHCHNFTAVECKQFCIGNDIKHILTAPYHPSTNGEAKRFVQTFKTWMQKHKGALQKNLCQFLLHYQSTPYHYWKDSSWDHVW